VVAAVYCLSCLLCWLVWWCAGLVASVGLLRCCAMWWGKVWRRWDGKGQRIAANELVKVAAAGRGAKVLPCGFVSGVICRLSGAG